jgi:plasmid stabilization system protein ParE
MALMIKWNKRAIQQLDDAIEYIEEDSPVNAEKVRKEILLKIDAIPQHPEKHNPDKYKINNDGSFRAFELYHYRISYRYKSNEIRIIRIRHTKMNPLNF